MSACRGAIIPGTIDGFIARWTGAEQAERTNAPPFLIELCDLLGVERPEPARGGAGDYRFERSVTHREADTRETTRRIDLYKRGCFILEAKQGANTVRQPELFTLNAEATRRQAVRNSPGWAGASTCCAPRARRKATCATCRPTSQRRRS